MRGEPKRIGPRIVQFLPRVALAGLTIMLGLGSLFRGRRDARPRRGTVELADDHLLTADGTRLPLSRWAPQGEVEAVVLALHGYADFRAAYAGAGSWFAARRLAVYAYDQRGFGETASKGRWPGVKTMVLDLADALAVLRAHHDGVPAILLGEGMGAAIALAGLGQGAVSGADAVIAISPSVSGGLAPRRLHDQALKVAAPALPWFTQQIEQGAQPWLLPEALDRLVHDPRMLRKVRGDAHHGLLDLMAMASELPKVPMPPVLVVRGELDTTIAEPAIRDLTAKLGTTGTLRTYPDRHHLILESEGFEQVLDDALAWLIATLNRTDSAA